MKIITALLFVFIVFADQLIKFFVSKTISAQSISIFPEILKLKIHQNTGIAFGLPFNPWLAYFLVIILFGILIFLWQKKIILCHSRENGNPLSKRIKSSVESETIKEKFKVISIYPFILIFSGALSNLLDRARFGYVIDYVEFIPLRGFFNLADCAIVIGIIMIILKILNQSNVNQKRTIKDC
jgi:signal peptidase II